MVPEVVSSGFPWFPRAPSDTSRYQYLTRCGFECRIYGDEFSPYPRWDGPATVSNVRQAVRNMVAMAHEPADRVVFVDSSHKQEAPCRVPPALRQRGRPRQFLSLLAARPTGRPQRGRACRALLGLQPSPRSFTDTTRHYNPGPYVHPGSGPESLSPAPSFWTPASPGAFWRGRLLFLEGGERKGVLNAFDPFAVVNPALSDWACAIWKIGFALKGSLPGSLWRPSHILLAPARAARRDTATTSPSTSTVRGPTRSSPRVSSGSGPVAAVLTWLPYSRRGTTPMSVTIRPTVTGRAAFSV